VSVWYCTPKDELSQGDIFVDMPSVYVPEPVQTATATTCAGNSRHLVPASAEPELFGAQDQIMLARGNLTAAVVLTHDCEIDKDQRYRLLGLIRPLAGLPLSAVEEIKANNRRRFFYLPAEDEVYALPESYLDFRRITTVNGGVLQPAKRVLSMQDRLRDSMSEAFILYLTRAEA